jgi:hypothetical protein
LTDDRAFGVDDVAVALYNRHRHKLRKLRFLMTDNSAFSLRAGDLLIYPILAGVRDGMRVEVRP